MRRPVKEKFIKLQHLKCVHNDGAPNLIVGKFYSAHSIYDYTDSHGPDAWGTYVWGDPRIYHHSHFEAAIGSISAEDFAAPLTHRVETRTLN